MNSDSDSDPVAREKQIEVALQDPATRQRVAAALAREAPAPTPGRVAWERRRSFLTGLGSGAVLVLAFLLPSIQDQWNLYRSGRVIDQYVRIGSRLFEQRRYSAAEKAFEKAVEMSEGRRLDLIEYQMRAHVQRVNENVEWRGTVPGDISDGDFLYLLEMQSGPQRTHERAATLTAFGSWLAGAGRASEAEARLREALTLDPRNADAHVGLGNVLDDRGDQPGAEREYRRAIELDANDTNALYNLGLLLLDTARLSEAEALLRKYVALKPDDAEGHRQLATILAQGGATPHPRQAN